MALPLVKTHSSDLHWWKPMDLSLFTRCPRLDHLLLAVDVLVDLENIIPISLSYKALWGLHVHAPSNWGLGVSHNKVSLLGVPALDDGFGKDKPYGTPHCHWGIGVPIVVSLDLA